MKHFLPLLFAILLLTAQTGCKENTNTNTSNDNTNAAAVEQSPETGGGGPSSSETFPADPNCTGMRTVFVGPNANVVIQLDNGNQELRLPVTTASSTCLAPPRTRSLDRTPMLHQPRTAAVL